MESFPKPKSVPKTAERHPDQVTPAEEPNYDDARNSQIEKKEGGAPPGAKKSDSGGSGSGGSVPPEDDSSDLQSPTPKIRNPDLAARLKALKETPPGQPSEPNQTTETPNRGLANQLSGSDQQEAPKTQSEVSEGDDNI
jgi:hypothetical protein